MFRKKPKKSKLLPLTVASALMFTVAFHWSYVLELVIRGVMS